MLAMLFNVYEVISFQKLIKSKDINYTVSYNLPDTCISESLCT